MSFICALCVFVVSGHQVLLAHKIVAAAAIEDGAAGAGEGVGGDLLRIAEVQQPPSTAARYVSGTSIHLENNYTGSLQGGTLGEIAGRHHPGLRLTA